MLCKDTIVKNRMKNLSFAISDLMTKQISQCASVPIFSNAFLVKIFHEILKLGRIKVFSCFLRNRNVIREISTIMFILKLYTYFSEHFELY